MVARLLEDRTMNHEAANDFGRHEKDSGERGARARGGGRVSAAVGVEGAAGLKVSSSLCFQRAGRATTTARFVFERYLRATLRTSSAVTASSLPSSLLMRFGSS